MLWHGRTNWHQVRHEAQEAMRAHFASPSLRLEGKIRRLEDGLNHANYAFWIEGEGADKEAADLTYILRILAWEEEDQDRRPAVERLLKEAKTLQALEGRDFPYDVPRFVCFVGDQDEPDGLIETAAGGPNLAYLRKLDDKKEYVLGSVAQVAAAVHRLPPEAFPHLERAADSRAHVLAKLKQVPASFAGGDPDAAEAVEFIIDHLPSDRPAVMLHGDLLPQNILFELGNDQLGVIDWEYARIGDPAHDLAIVTRGHAKPLGLGGGPRRLVEAYRAAGGQGVSVADVMIHELLLSVNWLWGSIQREQAGIGAGHPPQTHRLELRAILRRARSPGTGQ